MTVPSWLHFAVYELGQHEIEGGTDNPRIQEYLASVGMVAAAVEKAIRKLIDEATAAENEDADDEDLI